MNIDTKTTIITKDGAEFTVRKTTRRTMNELKELLVLENKKGKTFDQVNEMMGVYCDYLSKQIIYFTGVTMDNEPLEYRPDIFDDMPLDKLRTFMEILSSEGQVDESSKKE